MLVALLADTHLRGGLERLPGRCLEIARSADVILHAGDVVSIQALEELAALGPPLHAVHGNVDEPAVRERLPETDLVVAGGVRMALIHDAGPARGRPRRMRARFPDADLVVFGHSHMPLHEQADGFAIFNPGSPTQRRRAPRRTMGLARVGDGSISLELVAV